MKSNFLTFLLIVASFVLSMSCEATLIDAPEENELLDGPQEGLTEAQQLQFFKGDEAFGDVFTVEKGLGPIFVANQCASCHREMAKDRHL